MACPNCTAECYNTHNSKDVQDPVTKEWNFKACSICVVRCNDVYKHKDSAMARPYPFLKVLVKDFSMVLRLPPVFAMTVENKRHRFAFLEGPTGGVYKVEISLTNGGMAFTEGWSMFVSANELEAGEILLFRHFGEMHFKVNIHGRSCCERTPFISTMTKQGQRSITVQNVADNFNHAFIPTNNSNNIIAKDTYRRKKGFSKTGSNLNKGLAVKRAVKTKVTVAKTKVESNSNVPKYKQQYYESCRRAITEAERRKTLAESQKFKSKHPFVLMVMKKSQVYQGFMLSIPKDFCTKHMPKTREYITLIGPTGKEIQANFLGDKENAGLSGGWRSFSLAHNLEADDVCIFELVAPKTLKIHIYRVVEEYVPPRKVEVKEDYFK